MKYKNCKLIDPATDVCCSYKGYFYVQKRHRNGSFYVPEQWVRVTEDYYQFILRNGAICIAPTLSLLKALEERHE